MTRIIRLTKFNDPGHGWLAVPHALIRELGIADKITSFSHMNLTNVYLEEDCDVATFEEAAKASGMINDMALIKHKYTNNQSRIRSLGSYNAAFIHKPLEEGDEIVMNTPGYCVWKITTLNPSSRKIFMTAPLGQEYRIPYNNPFAYFLRYEEKEAVAV